MTIKRGITSQTLQYKDPADGIVRLESNTQSSGSFVEINPAAGTLRWFVAGVRDVTFTVSNPSVLINTSIAPTGALTLTDGSFATVNSGSGFAAQNSAGQLLIASSGGAPQSIRFIESGVAFRGIIGFNTGSGDFLILMNGATTFTDGTEQLRVLSSVASNQTAIKVLTNTSSAGLSNQQVTLGAPNSGGAGFRVLIVPN